MDVPDVVDALESTRPAVSDSPVETKGAYKPYKLNEKEVRSLSFSVACDVAPQPGHQFTEGNNPAWTRPCPGTLFRCMLLDLFFFAINQKVSGLRLYTSHFATTSRIALLQRLFFCLRQRFLALRFPLQARFASGRHH